MLGCTPPGRHVEQHDIFFGIAASLNELADEIKAFWPEPTRIHVDAWREVSLVDGYQVNIAERTTDSPVAEAPQKLFFINLGGYQPNKFEEQHYVLLTVKKDMAAASREAKDTFFYQHNGFEGATSHIDDKYGIDVDDIYNVEDILSDAQKAKYSIVLSPAIDSAPDELHLGYLKMSVLESDKMVG